MAMSPQDPNLPVWTSGGVEPTEPGPSLPGAAASAGSTPAPAAAASADASAPASDAPPATEPVVPLPLVAAARPRRFNATTGLLLVLAGLVAMGGAGYAIGRVTSGNSGTASNVDGRSGQDAGTLPGLNGNFGNGGFDRGRDGLAPNASGLPVLPDTDAVLGTVTAVTSDSITVQRPNGESVTIATTSSTTWHAKDGSTISTVQVGWSVRVTTTHATAAASAATRQSRTATDVTVTSN
jgi:hypothetical protein